MFRGSKKLKNVRVSWRHKKYTEIKNSDSAPFYALSLRDELLYIGQTSQKVKSEVYANLKRLRLNSKSITVWLGRITESGYGRITKKLVMDIENLMIAEFKPLLNERGRKNYKGRPEISVTLEGCHLFDKIYCEQKWKSRQKTSIYKKLSTEVDYLKNKEDYESIMRELGECAHTIMENEKITVKTDHDIHFRRHALLCANIMIKVSYDIHSHKLLLENNILNSRSATKREMFLLNFVTKCLTTYKA